MGKEDFSGKVHPPSEGPLNGPIQDRKCRDVLFLLLFCAMWVGMFFVLGIALDKGDPTLLVLPMDYAGNFCGRNNLPPSKRPWMDQLENGRNTTDLKQDFTEKKYLYFITPFNANATKCVAECPQENTIDALCSFPSSASVFPSWASNFVTLPNPAANNSNCECTYPQDKSQPQICFSKYKASPIARRCVPGNASMISEQIKSETAKVNDMISRTAYDFQRGWKWVLISAFIALVLGFIWLLILRFLAGIMVWLTIILCLAGCCALSFYTFNEGNTRRANAEASGDPDLIRNAKALQILSYIFFGITGALFLITVFMFKRIQIAIEIIKLAGRAVNAMPTVVIVPLIAFVAVGLVFTYMAAIGVYLYSAGDITYDGFSRSFTFDKELKKVIAYHLFGCIWTILFIIGICQVTIAGGVAQYYFSREGERPISLVGASFYRVIRYHLGSIAFGSMIIAIVVMIRITLEYIKRQMKKDNTVLKKIICIIECCMSCFQRFIEFLTTNAYIQIAIKGESFCSSAKAGWSLVVRNILRVTATTVVSTFVIFLGTLFIVVATMFCCNEMLKRDDPPIESFLILLFTFFLAYVIAMLFMGIYEMAIKTTLQCFCMDEEQNGRENSYAPDSLKQYMDKNTTKAAKKISDN